jgi:hypothetical protein
MCCPLIRHCRIVGSIYHALNSNLNDSGKYSKTFYCVYYAQIGVSDSSYAILRQYLLMTLLIMTLLIMTKLIMTTFITLSTGDKLIIASLVTDFTYK